MPSPLTPIARAEQVASLARALGVETALIGAYALAFHQYVRGTQDTDLAACTELSRLGDLRRSAEAAGLKTRLILPDDSDPLGGKLTVWEDEDEDGDPIEQIDVVNFLNPHRPRVTPAARALRSAIPVPGHDALRCVLLPDLVALKLFADSSQDDADIVQVLAINHEADLEDVRAAAKSYGFDRIDELIARALERRESG